MSTALVHNAKHDFLPEREHELLAWSRNFNARINSPPGPAAFGLTAAQASHYTTLHDAFAAGYALSRNTTTNSKAAIIAKNQAKKSLKAEARSLARIIRANPSITNDVRGLLALTVPDQHLTPVNVSDQKPLLMLHGTIGRTVRLSIHGDASTYRRARPEGMIGALILSYVAPSENSGAASPPASMSKWSYCGHAMRSKFQVTVPSDVPAGSKVWIAACWVNTRGKTGPFSTAVSTCIGDGVGNFAGAPALRMAA